MKCLPVLAYGLYAVAGIALFAFPYALVPAVFVEDPTLYTAALMAPAPLFWAGAACRVWGSRKRMGQLLLFLAGASGASGAAYILSGSAAAAVLCMVGSTFFLLCGRLGIRAASRTLWFIGMGGYLLALLFINPGAHNAHRTALQWAGTLYFIAGIVELNIASVRWGVQPVSAKERQTKPPKPLLRANLLLTCLFLSLSACIAFFDSLRAAIAAAAAVPFRAVFWLLGEISRLLGRGESSMAPVHQDGFNLSEGLPMAEGSPPPAWVDTLILVVGSLTAVAALALLLGYLVKVMIRKLPGFWVRLLNRLFAHDGSYVDETESLWSFERAKIRVGARLRAITNRLRRPARWEDMPDNRLKVRFAFQKHLQQHRSAYSPFRTADDWQETPSGSNMRRFTEAYNRARYGSDPISNQDAEIAREVNGAL
jgi:hypothetical protein